MEYLCGFAIAFLLLWLGGAFDTTPRRGGVVHPKMPTERPRVPCSRPPANPTPPSGDLRVESAAESDPFSTPLLPPSLPSRSMFASEREYWKAVRKQIAQQQPDETWVERPSMKTLEAEHEYKRLLRQKEIEQAAREQEVREARQREADAARSKPLEDNEVYGMMGQTANLLNKPPNPMRSAQMFIPLWKLSI